MFHVEHRLGPEASHDKPRAASCTSSALIFVPRGTSEQASAPGDHRAFSWEDEAALNLKLVSQMFHVEQPKQASDIPRST
jgi:hypothetical protein